MAIEIQDKVSLVIGKDYRLFQKEFSLPPFAWGDYKEYKLRHTIIAPFDNEEIGEAIFQTREDKERARSSINQIWRDVTLNPDGTKTIAIEDHRYFGTLFSNEGKDYLMMPFQSAGLIVPVYKDNLVLR